MAGEGILSIGATVDKTGVDAGLRSIQDGVQATVQTVAVQVEETCARTRAAWNKLSDDVKVASHSVSTESLKVAQATKAQTAALADLRRAQILARDANIGDVESTAILASAQQKVAIAALDVAAAKEDEAAAVAAAAEEESLSANFVVAAFQRAAIGVRESCALIQEKMVETAETGKLSAEGIAAGFSGLGVLLGGGLIVGFAGHFLDELAKVNVEIGHVSIESGMAVASLAGLQQIVKESGSDWGAVATGLVRMNKNLADSVEPSAQLERSLEGVNLTFAQLKGLTPEEKLARIAEAFAGTTNSGNRAAAAIAIFGRGGRELIPTLVEQGSTLDESIIKQGRLTGITEESVSSSREWTADIAMLSATFRSFMIPVMEAAAAGAEKLQEAYVFFAAGVLEASEAASLAIRTLQDSFVGLGKIAQDVFTGNWGAIRQDWQTSNAALVEDWKRSAGQIFEINAALADDIDKLRAPKPGAAGDNGTPADGGGSGSGGGSSASVSPWIAATQASQKRNFQAWFDQQRQQVAQSQAGIAGLGAAPGFMDASGLGGQQAGGLGAFQSQAPKVVEAVRQMSKQVQQEFQKMFQGITAPLNTFVDHWITSGQRMGQAFQRMGDQMAMNLVNVLLRMAEKWAENELLMTLKHAVGIAQRKTADAAAATAQIGMAAATATAVTTANAVQIAGNVAVAHSAAGTAAAVAAAEAAPLGVIAAIAAGAETYAAIEPYVALAAFDQGGIMGHGKMGVNLSGADERVLSPSQTRIFEHVMNQGSSDNSKREIHFHDHSQWSGVDGASVAGMYRQHAQSGRREMMRQLRLANAI